MWNRIALLMVIVVAANLLLTPIDVEARGGGRGGGGRSSGSRSGAAGGGAYRGGNTMNRTPTMSRASNRPAVSPARQQNNAKPSVAQNRAQAARQTVPQRPSVATRAELRNQVDQYAQNRPVQNIDRNSPAQKTQDFSGRRENQITQNRQLSDKVSQRLQESRPDSSQWFDQKFYDRHNMNIDYVRAGANLWRPAAWATLATWGNWGWSTPYYYDYDGSVYPITVAESTSTFPYSTTTISSQSVPTQLTQSEQTMAGTGGDWLPLGVFAVVSDYAAASNANAAAQANRFIQLAINRSGEISGVLYNSAVDTAHNLAGMVDPNSQKAYWTMTDRANSPIASTGIYNLTEDETPINVHFADGSDQAWVLVRLQQG